MSIVSGTVMTVQRTIVNVSRASDAQNPKHNRPHKISGVMRVVMLFSFGTGRRRPKRVAGHWAEEVAHSILEALQQKDAKDLLMI